MTTLSLKEQVDNLLIENKKSKELIMEKSRTLFKEAIQDFWEKNPSIKAFVWEQYTPYFNDGEPCIFSVGAVGFTVIGDPEYHKHIGYGEFYDEDVGDPFKTFTAKEVTNPSPYIKKEKEHISNNLHKYEFNPEDLKAIDSIITQNDELMESLFGDHVKIIATRSGFKVTEFEHD